MSATFPEPSWGQRLLSGLQTGQTPQFSRSNLFSGQQQLPNWAALRQQLAAARAPGPTPTQTSRHPLMNRAQLQASNLAGLQRAGAQVPSQAQSVIAALLAGHAPAAAAQTPQSIQAAALQGLPNAPAAQPPPVPAAPVAQPSTQPLPVANPYDPGLGTAYPASTPLDRGGYELGVLTPEQRAALVAQANAVMPGMGQGGSYQYTAI